MAKKKLTLLFADTWLRPPQLLCGKSDEMRCKVSYVFSPLAERGNVQWKNAQPVIEIFAETPCSYIRNKVAVGCCDDTHTGANQQRIRISGAKLPIPRELLAGYPQLAPDPSV